MPKALTVQHFSMANACLFPCACLAFSSLTNNLIQTNEELQQGENVKEVCRWTFHIITLLKGFLLHFWMKEFHTKMCLKKKKNPPTMLDYPVLKSNKNPTHIPTDTRVRQLSPTEESWPLWYIHFLYNRLSGLDSVDIILWKLPCLI